MKQLAARIWSSAWTLLILVNLFWAGNIVIGRAVAGQVPPASTRPAPARPAAHDYLRRMCAAERYMVIDNVAALPAELTKVYRALTRASGRGR